MDACPCCGSPLLRHIEHNRIYWYCQHCHQEMPNLSFLMSRSKHTSPLPSPLGTLVAPDNSPIEVVFA